MYHIVYLVTNKTNGKLYVGKHSTKNIDDGYLGSGKGIKRAIDKYGIENFEKKVLGSFPTSEAALSAERLIVSTELVNDKKFYNMIEGGYSNMSRQREWYKEKSPFFSEKTKERILHAQRENGKKTGKQNIGKFNQRLKEDENLALEIRQKRSFGGKKNTGKIHITDGIQQVVIDRNSEIPEGWWFGGIKKGPQKHRKKRNFDEETRKKLSESVRKTLSEKGNPMNSEENRKKVGLSKLGKKKYRNKETDILKFFKDDPGNEWIILKPASHKKINPGLEI